MEIFCVYQLDKVYIRVYIVYMRYIQYIHERGEKVQIIISNSSEKPIYEQITTQIKNMIISGELKPGDALPSMRFLAKELHISVITTKRAYEELERGGFIYSVVGKGSFVKSTNMELLKEEKLRLIEEYLSKAVDEAKKCSIDYEEIESILKLLYEEE